MKVLGIDTSTKFLSVALIDTNDTLAFFNDKAEFRHSELLIPTIDKMLKKCHLRLKDINAIALSIGPGSFTGLRIGAATCKAISLALGTPIVAVPTLDAIAYNFIGEKEEILCPLLDAKKSLVYACFYKNRLPNLVGLGKAFPKPTRFGRRLGLGLGKAGLGRLGDYMLTDVERLLKMIGGPKAIGGSKAMGKPTLIFGDGVGLYGEYLRKNPLVNISTKDWHPKAETVARLGLEKAMKKKFTNPDKLVPMYLHSRYCQVKK